MGNKILKNRSSSRTTPSTVDLEKWDKSGDAQDNLQLARSYRLFLLQVLTAVVPTLQGNPVKRIHRDQSNKVSSRESLHGGKLHYSNLITKHPNFPDFRGRCDANRDGSAWFVVLLRFPGVLYAPENGWKGADVSTHNIQAFLGKGTGLSNLRATIGQVFI